MDADLKTLTDLYFDCRKKWNNKGKLRIAERFIEIRDQGLFNNSDEEEEDDEDDEDDDGESGKEKLTEKEKRALREKEEAKAKKDQDRATAKSKSAATRAASAASAQQDDAVVANDEYEKAMQSTGGSTVVQAPVSEIVYAPPEEDTFSSRPTTMDTEGMRSVSSMSQFNLLTTTW